MKQELTKWDQRMLDQMLERDKRKGIPPAKTQERFDRWFEDEYLIPRTDIKR